MVAGAPTVGYTGPALQSYGVTTTGRCALSFHKGETRMNVLVTGCAGFIASCVAHLLVEQGHRVVGVDNLNDAYDVALKDWRLARLQDAGIPFHRADIEDSGELTAIVRQHRPDAIVNLAARAGVRQSIANPEAYYSTNVGGTLNLLQICNALGVGKFVLASTSSVYGLADRPFSESQSTDRPLSPYAASKKAAEEMCYAYHHLFDIDVTVFRYFTVYGPAGRPDMSIFRFIRWIAEGEPLALYGDGSQERDFTYVGDVARGTAAALELTGFQVINLGSDRPVALNTLIGLVEAGLGAKAIIDRQPTHPTDVPATWADISRARELMGWEPEVSLQEGLDASIGWYMQNREWASKVALG